MENQGKPRNSTNSAEELDQALGGARQHLQALRQSNEWQDLKKRRQFLQDFAKRLRSILDQIEAEI